MIEIIKDGVKAWVETKSKAQPYLKAGWKVVAEVEVKEDSQEQEVTKKDLQGQLDKLGIAYTPRDTKATLVKKLESAQPDNDFDDGLLKG